MTASLACISLCLRCGVAWQIVHFLFHFDEHHITLCATSKNHLLIQTAGSDLAVKAGVLSTLQSARNTLANIVAQLLQMRASGRHLRVPWRPAAP